MVDAFLKLFEETNRYGFPLPIIIVLGFFYFVRVTNSKLTARERIYQDLLGSLGAWNDAVSDMLTYYIEPGSSYNDEIPKGDRFKRLLSIENKSLKDVREQMNVARMFLSDKTIVAVDELIADNWYITELGSSCTEDSLRQISKIVKNAYALILNDAKHDFTKGRYLKAFVK